MIKQIILDKQVCQDVWVMFRTVLSFVFQLCYQATSGDNMLLALAMRQWPSTPKKRINIHFYNTEQLKRFIQFHNSIHEMCESKQLSSTLTEILKNLKSIL